MAEKARRRKFTAQYKLGLLGEADRCEAGEIGALLRREGLYSSHLSTWKRQRETGALKALGSRKRGRKAKACDARAQRLEALERENEGLRRRLAQAQTIIPAHRDGFSAPHGGLQGRGHDGTATGLTGDDQATPATGDGRGHGSFGREPLTSATGFDMDSMPQAERATVYRCEIRASSKRMVLAPTPPAWRSRM